MSQGDISVAEVVKSAVTSDDSTSEVAAHITQKRQLLVEDGDGKILDSDSATKRSRVDKPDSEAVEGQDTVQPAVISTGVSGFDVASKFNRQFKVMSWNVNGLRAVLKKDAKYFAKLLVDQDADVVFFEEVKMDDSVIGTVDFPAAVTKMYPYKTWSLSIRKKGYSGLLMLSKTKPLNVIKAIGLPDADEEGRLICAEFDFGYVVNCYVPNAGQKLDRLDFRTTKFEPKMREFLKKLNEGYEGKVGKPVIYSGDLNVAFAEIDVWDSKKNQKTAGHTPEERAEFGKMLQEGWVDVFRHYEPETIQYTFWGARSGYKAGGKGWRIDYFIVSPDFINNCNQVVTLDETEGSDHVPICLTFGIN